MCFLNKSMYKHLGSKLQKIFLLDNVNLYELPNLEKNLKQHEKNLKNENKDLENLLNISG